MKAEKEEAHIYRREKYADFIKEKEQSGHQATIMSEEIGVTGFITSSAYDLLSNLPYNYVDKRTSILNLFNKDCL